MIDVVVADDNAVIRNGLRALLASDAEINVVAEAGNGAEAVAAVAAHNPDLALVDIRMPVMNGVDATREIDGACPVLILTYTDDDEIVVDAIRAGACGYLVHGRFEPDELVRAVRRTVDGETVLAPAVASVALKAIRGEKVEAKVPQPQKPYGVEQLSAREIDVIDLVSQGRPNGEIADALFLSEKTVKNHINRIYAKLGVGSRAEAIAVWLGVRRAEV